MHLSRLYTKIKLDLRLAVLASVCLCLMLSIETQIVFSLSVSIFSAIVMFYFLIRLPEYERKKRIKRHLQFSYESFKRSVIHIFVSAIQEPFDSDIVDQLMDQRTFRNFFKEPYVAGQDRWHGVANKMNDFLLGEIVLETEILLNEFHHALGSIDIRVPENYSFIKRLSVALYRAKNSTTEYNKIKEMLSFFWMIFAGWSSADGYSDREYISDIISEL